MRCLYSMSDDYKHGRVCGSAMPLLSPDGLSLLCALTASRKGCVTCHRPDEGSGPLRPSASLCRPLRPSALLALM